MATDSNQIRNRHRCHHCAGPLSKELETSNWTISPVIRDCFSYLASGVGGLISAFYASGYVMPIVKKHVKGPIWLPFLIGRPPIMLFTAACAGLVGGAVPAVIQLGSSSYHAAKASPPVQTPPSKDAILQSSTRSSSVT